MGFERYNNGWGGEGLGGSGSSTSGGGPVWWGSVIRALPIGPTIAR